MLRALMLRFFAQPRALGLDSGSPGRPRRQFWRPNSMDFRASSLLVRPLSRDPPTLTKHCVGARISSLGLSLDDAKTSQNRSASAFDVVRCAERARVAFQCGPGASRVRPWDAFGRLPAALGSPGRSKIGPGAAFGHPGPAPRTPQRAPKTEMCTQNIP